MARATVHAAAALCLLAASMAQADVALTKVRPFLKKHCYSCHGPKTQKGDYRFDTLGVDLTHVPTLEAWQNILDQLNLGEMPPKKQPQPTQAEVAPVVDLLSSTLKLAYAQKRSTGGQAVIRRLNRIELRNTLRDLLYLQGAAYRPGAVAKLVDNNGNGRVERKGADPVRAFPEDEQEHGFVNIGGRLVMSDFLLKLTLAAAEESLQAATHLEKKPDVQTRRFAGHLVTGKQYGQQTLETVSRELHPDFDMMVLRYQRYGRLAPHALRGGVGTAARFRVTVVASGHNQTHPWGDLIKTDQAQSFLLGLHVADTANGGIAGPTSTPLAQWPLPGDGKKRTFTFETWIDKTWTPWVGWENGPYDRAFRAEALVEKYLPQAFTPRPDRKKVDKQAYDAWPIDMARALLKNGYKGPHIRIHSMTLEPLIDAWPPRSHAALYGSGPVEKADIEKLMLGFAERAFRRPVKPVDVAPYVALVKQQIEGDAEPGGAVKDLTFKVYKGAWTKLPDFAKLKPVSTGALADGLIDIRAANLDSHYGIVFDGKLHAPRDGDYQFEVASDDGSRLIIDGRRVINHDGLHGASTKKGGMRLKAGDHAFRVEYFAYGAPNSFRASWSGPGFGGAPLSVGRDSPKQLAAGNAQALRTIQALQAGYAAILCSPRFLYIHEKSGRLDDFEIASRLSYFLWSSMPDERLMDLARAGKLTDADMRQREVERMLNDSKAEAFIQNFTTAWLRLDRLGKMPPERAGPFRFYHDRKMEPMMLTQAAAYFGDLVKNNGKVGLIIDSDYTFMNETVAQWIYGRTDVGGDQFQKVAVSDPRRGGMLTLPAVMTSTANGVDTSPVVRGVWVLENVLGTPPSPPPPDVEPLPTDLREAKTIRQQLELHRKHEACNGCHRKIDPMGFAMENFDPVGRWRDRYPKAKEPIDAAATMPDGRRVADIVEFKKHIMQRKRLVLRCLTEKMLTYASGRLLEPTDRGDVDTIVAELEAKGEGVRDLIHLVVQSPMFLNK